jgi:hypothetical protein
MDIIPGAVYPARLEGAPQFKIVNLRRYLFGKACQCCRQGGYQFVSVAHFEDDHGAGEHGFTSVGVNYYLD